MSKDIEPSITTLHEVLMDLAPLHEDVTKLRSECHELIDEILLSDYRRGFDRGRPDKRFLEELIDVYTMTQRIILRFQRAGIVSEKWVEDLQRKKMVRAIHRVSGKEK